MNEEDQQALQALEGRLKTLLPEQYEDRYETVQPVSMGSAGLKYGPDGKVAWGDIWSSFCDLAMAGGPPHKGMLLEPGSPAEIAAEPRQHRAVVEEICRGVLMVAGLPAYPSAVPGWVSVDFANHGAAGWSLRAITMENISARAESFVLDLPAGPAYRVEKEIKNVITAVAKTSHYWLGHMQLSRRRIIASLLAEMQLHAPLVYPALSGHGFRADRHQMLSNAMAETLLQSTGLHAVRGDCAGWLGLECHDAGAAIWMMRSLVASNVLSRREGTVLFVPVNPALDPGGERVLRSLAQVHRFAMARGLLQ